MTAAAAATLPLLAPRDLAAPLAWHRGRPISGAQFLADAAALAERLPPHGRPLNLCQDRYRFALAFAAALLRGQTSLLPPNALPETLAGVTSGANGGLGGAGGAGGADGGTELGAEDGAASTAAYALFDAMPPGGLGALPAVAVAVAEPAAAGLAPVTAVPRIPATQRAACLLTSGSTGAPQPHAKRWDALVANIAAEAERLAALIGRPSLHGLAVLATVPAQHSYGFESSVLLALLGGAAFDSGRPYYPADIAAALACLPRPRALVTTPFHLKTLLLAGVDLPPVDLVLSATAPLSPQLAGQAEARLGGPLVEIYGCTEAGQVATRRTTAGDVWQTLGGLRVWREAAEGSELFDRFLVHGGHVQEPTPLADVLVLADDRHFRLLGRANDLIHVAGKRSSVAHLNFQLNRIPGVDDGAFWMPDDVADGVVRPLAFVVAPTLRAADVIQALRHQLEPAFVPRRVLQVPALPREATGKLTAQALARFARETLAARHGQAAAAGPTAGPFASASSSPDARSASTAGSTPGSSPGSSRGSGTAGDPSTAPTGAPVAPVTPFDIAPDHPAFAGHFPGHPLLPGVVLLSLVLQALRQQPALQQRLGPAPTIDSVKFLAPVGPGAQLAVALQSKDGGSSGSVAFDVLRGTTVVARGQLSPGSPGMSARATPGDAGIASATPGAPAAAPLFAAPAPPPAAPSAVAAAAATAPVAATVTAPATVPTSADWTRAKERSNRFALALMAWIAVHLGRHVARLVLHPVTLYFVLFSPAARRQSIRYMARALGRWPSWADGYRHVHAFASTVLDRLYFVRGRLAEFDLRISGESLVEETLAEGRGAFLLGAHIGSFEALHTVGASNPGMRVAMAMYPDNARLVHGVLEAIAPGFEFSVIPIGQAGATLQIRDWLDSGGLVGVLGDRFLPSDAARPNVQLNMLRIPFLGTPAPFSDGPLRLAMLLRRRVIFMSALYRGGNRYDLRFKQIADFRVPPASAAERSRQTEAALRAYVAELETLCRTAPYNWFNFHDFWHEDEDVGPQAR